MLKGVFRMVAANRECEEYPIMHHYQIPRNTCPIMLYTILSYHYWNPSQKFRNVVSIPYWFTLLISAIIIKKTCPKLVILHLSSIPLFTIAA